MSSKHSCIQGYDAVLLTDDTDLSENMSPPLLGYKSISSLALFTQGSNKLPQLLLAGLPCRITV